MHSNNAYQSLLFYFAGIFPIFQYITIQVLYQQHFTRFETDDPLVEAYAYEGSVVNIVALAQLMIASVVSTVGEPFRKPWYQNRTHLAVMLVQSGWIFYLLFGADSKFMYDMTNKPTSDNFAGILIGIIAANIFASAVVAKIMDFIFFWNS